MPSLKPLGYQQLTVSGSAVGLTVPKGASSARIQVSGGTGVRYRDDGTNPTSAVGIPKNAVEFTYNGNLNTIKFIRVSTDATLDIAYYDHSGEI